ncbi:hypothetical protein [Nannocystis pusilla]|uniref:hypothetical protein n=1 Tax=Nannocystis pusilla TaxID=889268 RepID=UPI003B77E2CB
MTLASSPSPEHDRGPANPSSGREHAQRHHPGPCPGTQPRARASRASAAIRDGAIGTTSARHASSTCACTIAPVRDAWASVTVHSSQC